MPLRTVNMDLRSAIHDQIERDEVVSRGLTRIAKRYKQVVKDRMVMGSKTGRIYSRPGIPGARRYHRASARGEAPAVMTFNLVNSVEDEKIDAFSHKVYVDDQRAPYGKWLEDPQVLDRPISRQEQMDEFAANEMQQDLADIQNELNRS